MLTSYKDLKVWKKAYCLCLLVYQLTSEFPKEEKYGLVSQMRRSVLSIPSNIAEGYSRKHRKEYLRFINIAFASCAELETQTLLSIDLGLAYQEKTEKVLEEISEVKAMLYRLYQSLSV